MNAEQLPGQKATVVDRLLTGVVTAVARWPWLVLGAFASAAPEHFVAYVRDPKKENARAQMPGNPDYDDATLQALRDYFATFVPAEKR